MMRPIKITPLGQDSRVLFTYSPSRELSSSVRSTAGHAIVLAHWTPSGLGWTDRTTTVLLVALAARLVLVGWC